MNIADLIVKLVELEDKHGSSIEVMIEHTFLGDVMHIPAENGCPEYINLESE